ncbi:type II toxin-antitoxin system Rv0910 family toxin [Rhodococcus sp. 05-2254-6]|uniref:type II toxin-antitoxin system Rv0910 family toxin n=1 Tax=Rhodococcus sp. 05-2254-6 TaxID=2022489 RepID=UPI0015C64EC2|nr:SRPBCC family protein [Rhodococcus sp. 05-2254-6]
MLNIAMTQELSAPQDKVWSTLSDVSTFEKWHALHEEWVQTPPRDLEVGSTMVEKIKIASITDTIEFQVESLRAPEELVLVGAGSTGSMIRLTMNCAARGSGSAVTLELEVTSPLLFGVVGKALQGTFRKKLTATLNGLAEYLA